MLGWPNPTKPGVTLIVGEIPTPKIGGDSWSFNMAAVLRAALQHHRYPEWAEGGRLGIWASMGTVAGVCAGKAPISCFRT